MLIATTPGPLSPNHHGPSPLPSTFIRQFRRWPVDEFSRREERLSHQWSYQEIIDFIEIRAQLELDFNIKKEQEFVGNGGDRDEGKGLPENRRTVHKGHMIKRIVTNLHFSKSCMHIMQEETMLCHNHVSTLRPFQQIKEKDSKMFLLINPLKNTPNNRGILKKRLRSNKLKT